MSAYALAAHALGAQVSGSDRAESAYSRRLRQRGILDASIGHDRANVPARADIEVVYSSAVPAENPERVEARERGLRELSRGQLLGEISALRRTIAVAGAHGKTTTASMIVHALRGAGCDPSYLVGGVVGSTQSNAGWGSGEWLVIEADESDRSMLALSVEIAVVTNVELDHHATFGSLTELRDTFRRFLARPACAVLWDRAEVVALRQGPTVAYDLDSGVRLSADGSRFRWKGQEVRLPVPGAHNALNAVGALEACLVAGADAERTVTALADFRGAGRRFERVGRTHAGAEVYDDYAHHPTEISATVAAARTLDPGRVVVVFQPHLYSRTATLHRQFGEALAGADVVIVLDVYPARERAEDFPGVDGRLVARATADRAGGRPVYWLPRFQDALGVLDGLLRGGDLCLVLGAGDVDGFSRTLVGDADGRGRADPGKGVP
jgi:UDP-N-acetylmuramate--alanine ligase